MNDSIKWVKENLNIHSKTVCGAKWYNATIWLGNGMTASCHHPPPHKIDPEEVKINPSALHNTSYKKRVRKQMQEGIQCKECDYCWKIENLENDTVSDRFYKSVIYTHDELEKAFTSDWQEDSQLKTLEISFDSNCNFACSYCNAGYSTTWANDIKKNGSYRDLKSDGWGAFAHDGSWSMPNGPANKDNPYIEAFWKWWESELQHTLVELRVTGGEATVSNDFWKLIDWYKDNLDCRVRLAVNSNLGVKKNKLDKLIQASHYIKNMDLYTSNESIGINAEYIRDGLVWEEWKSNLEKLANEGNFNLLHVMLTLNALCLSSLDKMLDFVFDLREKTGVKIDTSYNILRFPSFQSITTLPIHIKKERYHYLYNWYQQNIERFNDWERDGFLRLLTYIKNVDKGHDIRNHSDIKKRQEDFVKFFMQYDKRRGFNFSDAFSNWPELVHWYNSFDMTVSNQEVKLINGDATEWGKQIYNEVMQNE